MRADSIVFTIAGMCFGVILGYVLGTQQAQKGTAATFVQSQPAAQPAPAPAAEPADAARIERAQALVAQYRCNFCHNKDYSGQQNVPRLAGQREDYLLKALRDYKSNARRGYDEIMDDVLYPLNDDNFQDLAHFLSRQR